MTSSPPMSEPFDKAVAVLAEAKSLVLACHVGPDGDALGSMLGLGMAAKAAGKTVILRHAIRDPGGVPVPQH